MSEEARQRGSDRVESGDHEEAAYPVQLVTSYWAPVHLDLEEPSDDVLTKVTTAFTPIKLGCKPSFTIVERRLASGVTSVAPADNDVLEGHEVLSLGLRDPHDREKYRGWQRITPLGIGIYFETINELIDELVGSCRNSRLEYGQLSRCEYRVEDLAPLGVFGAIELQWDRDKMAAKPEFGTLAAAGHAISRRGGTKLSHRV